MGATVGIAHRRLGIAIANVCGFLACTSLTVLMPPAAAAPQGAAAAQPAAPAAQPTSSQDQGDNTGDDFIRPLKLLQLLYQYQTAPGSGSQKDTTREVTTDIVKLRSDYWIDLSNQWAVALRADLPFRAKNPITSDNPDGHFLHGVGDVDFQAALLHELDARWAIGFGARLTAPTGEDNIGSGKWQIMPAFGARYALPEIGKNSYLEPVVWYDVSFAGDPTKKNISNLRFAPTFRLGLPDHWFVTFYPSPDIRVNYGDPVTGQTGRLFLPFDFQIGRKLTKDLALSLEVGVPIIKDYPVYDFKTMVRLNMLF